MTISTKQAIIKITSSGKNFSKINYSRRMYAIIRRYTPEVVEGKHNECFADLTGLRTFLKMTYKEMAENIVNDIKREIGIFCTVDVVTLDLFLEAKNQSKKLRSVATYKEMNKLFASSSFASTKKRKSLTYKSKKLVVPFLGKVS